MEIAEVLEPGGVLADLDCSGKTRALRTMATAAARITGGAGRDIFDVLVQREKLGTTAVGNGIAIPHARLDGLDRIRAMFARLKSPVPFDSPDEQPVDLIFMLLAPPDSGSAHLGVLSRVVRKFRQPGYGDRLRASPDSAALYALLTGR